MELPVDVFKILLDEWQSPFNYLLMCLKIAG